jgi:hypothetical protein
MDFMFMGDEDKPGETVAVLAVREKMTKMGMATVVPSKSTGEFVAKRVMAFLKEIGCEMGDVIVRSDQEPAILSIIQEVGRLRAIAGGWRYICENSPVGSSQSNGMIERYVQSVQQQVRVIKSALEEKWRVTVEAKSAVVPWMVEYAAFLINRFEVAQDGKTGYERCKGRKAKAMGIEFGKAVLWRRRPVGGTLGKLTCRWEDGVYLGVKGKSGEIIIGDSRGVWKTRSGRRRPVEERWTATSATMVVGVPWRVNDNDPKVDGEKMEGIKMNDEQIHLEREVVGEPVPRRFRINKEDVEKYGYTMKCLGCKSILMNA